MKESREELLAKAVRLLQQVNVRDKCIDTDSPEGEYLDCSINNPNWETEVGLLLLKIIILPPADKVDKSKGQDLSSDVVELGNLTIRLGHLVKKITAERDALQTEVDFWEERVSELVFWATGGLLSKPDTAQCYIEDYHEERVLGPRIKEATAEITAERDEYCEKLAAIKEFCNEQLRIDVCSKMAVPRWVLKDILNIIIGSKERSNE